MTPKKTPKADLQRGRTLFFEIGLTLSLVLAIVVFSVGRGEKEIQPVSSPYPDNYVVQMAPVTTQQTKPVIPVASLVSVPGADVIQIVKDNPMIVLNENPFNDFNEGEFFIPGTPGGEPGLVDVPVGDVIFVNVEDMPKFQGGEVAKFRSWVNERIQYPKMAAELGIQGQVILSFVVEKDGSVSNIEVLSTPDRLLAQEAVRILEQSPKWKPGYQNDQPARVKFTLPIQFRMQ